MNGRQPSGHHPVHLFGERLISITGAQTCLDVSRGDSLQVGGKGGGKSGHGVALHQQDVGANLTQQRGKTLEDTRGHVRGRLTRGHEIEVVVGFEVEDGEHLVEHGPVLGRDADQALELLGALKSLDDRSHLDRLRAGPEDAEHTDHRPAATVRSCSAMVCIVTKR